MRKVDRYANIQANRLYKHLAYHTTQSMAIENNKQLKNYEHMIITNEIIYWTMTTTIDLDYFKNCVVYEIQYSCSDIRK